MIFWSIVKHGRIIYIIFKSFLLCCQHRLFVKKSKYAFGQNKIEYLGHIVLGEGVDVDPRKIQDIKDLPTPTSVKELRGFLGLTGYYRKFIPGYGKICKPLYLLTKKDGFHWDLSANKAFQQLKTIMSSPQVLALANFAIPFELECDASHSSIGAVLMQ